VNLERFFSDQGNVFRTLLLLLTVLAEVSRADLLWTFETYDARPGGQGGVYGYVFPSASSPGQSARHRASLSRGPSSDGWAATLAFDLDGPKYPSAGFGLMFESAAPVDLRALKTLTLRVRADRPRKVRLSLAPQDSVLKLAADTGVSFGRDTVVGTSWVDWTIQASDLAWPRWAAEVPSGSRDALLAQVFALQFDVGCETRSGVCLQDSGWLQVDDIHLGGVGGQWIAPPAGDCGGDARSIDAFASEPARQNDLGGWWYAYTDRSSLDTFARGASRVLNASNPDSAGSWSGPDLERQRADLVFGLRRVGVYSGYAAIETQLAPPVKDVPQARSYPNLASLSFRIGFDRGFPEALGGVVVHLRKAGRAFLNGRDHQVPIPRDSVERVWCLDLASFQQPSWSEWIEPFTPDSLLALSFEVRLPSSLDSASSGFHVGEIAFHDQKGAGVGPRSSGSRDRLRATPTGWELLRDGSEAASWRVLDPSGRELASGRVDAGTSRIAVPATGRGLAFLRVTGRSGSAVFRLLRP